MPVVTTLPKVISGLTFPDKSITPEYDALIRMRALRDGWLAGFNITVEDNAFLVGYGWNIVNGRENYNAQSSSDKLKFPLTYTNFNYVALVLILDKQTGTTSLDVTYYNRYNEFPISAEDQEAINSNVGARYYKKVIAAAAYRAADSTWFLYYSYPIAGSRLTLYPLEIPVSSWNDGTDATMLFPYADGQSNFLVTYSPASHDEWVKRGIYASGQTIGHIDFKAASTPTKSITAYIILI